MKRVLHLLLLALVVTACAAPPLGTPTTAPPASTPTLAPPLNTPTLTALANTPTPASPTSVPTATPETIAALVFLTDQANHPAAPAIQALGGQVRPTADLPAVAAAAQVVVAQTLDPATAPAAPGVRFIVLGGSALEAPNALILPADSQAWRPDQLGLLAGAAAGFAAANQRVAALGDPASPYDLAYRAGFQNGVRLTCPRCRIDLVDLPADPAAAATLAAQYVGFGAQVIFAPPTPAGEAAVRRAAQAGAWVVDPTGTLIDTDRVLVTLQTADPLTRVLQAALQPENLTWQTAAAPLRWPATTPLGAMDQRDVATLAAQLLSGELETGIDPATGQEK